MKKVRIGGASLNQTPIDWDNNKANIIEAIKQAREQNVQILCLPELCITGYGCEDLFLSEWIAQSALDSLMEILPLTQGIAVGLGLPYRFEGNTYNTTCMVKNGEILGFYAKQILANEGIHYEPRWFTGWPADRTAHVKINGNDYPMGDITFDLYGLKVGLEICEDAWNKERPACRLYEKGVELIINPSASHFSFQKNKIREDLVVTSSKSFNCGYLYVNQLGNESGRVIYDGDVIMAQKGHILAKNDRFSFRKVNLLCMDFEPEITDPHTPEIEDLYGSKNEEFRHACALGLFDYLRKSGARGYALSLSGGADSSSIAVLVYEMVSLGAQQLGKKAFAEALKLSSTTIMDDAIEDIVGKILVTAYQGTQNSSSSTFNSAKTLAESLGAEFLHWNIDDIVEGNTRAIENALKRTFNWDNDDITLQNIQARVRSPLIWMLANTTGKILLTTSNRSEGDVGYTTMDGDTSGSLAPIAGVDKQFLLEWLMYAETNLGHQALSLVNNLSPSAELRPTERDQTDEQDLMPYPLLREIEKLAIYQRKSPADVYQCLKETGAYTVTALKSAVVKFFRLWSANQWKRERLAPSFHLDTFNVDPKTWCRFPILSGSFRKELEELQE